MTFNRPTKVIVQLGSIILLSFLVGNCLDPIEFERPVTIKNGVAIQGKLNKGNPSYLNVSIREIFNFEKNSNLINVQSVRLIDGTGNSINIATRRDGVYYKAFSEAESDFTIEYGEGYKIRVEMRDDRIFESSLDTIFPVPTPEKLSVTKETVRGINSIGNVEDLTAISFSIDTPLKVSPEAENARLLWELESTHIFSDSPEAYGLFSCAPVRVDAQAKQCYVTSSLFTNYIPLNGPAINSPSIEKYELLEIVPNWLFAEGYYLTVYQESLTQASFEYWKQVHQLVSRTGDIFEPPDAKVITNLVNIDNPAEEVFGFFYATEEKALRAYVSPDLADNPRPFCPEPIIFGAAPPGCCNCLSFPNSTTEKPSWWIE